MLKRKIYYFLPPTFRFIIRRIYYFPIDVFEKLSGKRDSLTPPKGLVFVGPGDFKKTGEALLNQIKKVCPIAPDFRILDVGCGIGRLAVPLTKELSENGSYEGFDIVKKGIDWCNNHIKTRFPNFSFIHIDLKNDLYNLKTNLEANRFEFPYKENEFDLIILTSVFTHMMPSDVNNYLNQINRVLKKDGKCFVTFFLLNDEIKSFISKREFFNFPFVFENYRLLDKKVKEANIAYEEQYLLKELIEKNNLKVDQLHYGWWSGKPRENCLGFQDTLVLKKQ